MDHMALYINATVFACFSNANILLFSVLEMLEGRPLSRITTAVFRLEETEATVFRHSDIYLPGNTASHPRLPVLIFTSVITSNSILARKMSEPKN
jgi:hypothetical protein